MTQIHQSVDLIFGPSMHWQQIDVVINNIFVKVQGNIKCTMEAKCITSGIVPLMTKLICQCYWCILYTVSLAQLCCISLAND